MTWQVTRGGYTAVWHDGEAGPWIGVKGPGIAGEETYTLPLKTSGDAVDQLNAALDLSQANRQLRPPPAQQRAEILAWIEAHASLDDLTEISFSVKERIEKIRREP